MESVPCLDRRLAGAALTAKRREEGVVGISHNSMVTRVRIYEDQVDTIGGVPTLMEL